MKNLIIFLSGVAIGGAAVWFYQERKYETLIDEEIESVKEVFSYNAKPEAEVSDVTEALKNIADEAINKPSISDIYNTKLSRENYIQYNTKPEPELTPEEPEKKEKEVVEKPYVIDQGDFRQFSDYRHITLDYYKDGILADADFPDDPIDNVKDIVGDCLKQIKDDNVDDWIYVRNDARKADYEIFINDKEFAEREEE